MPRPSASPCLLLVLSVLLPHFRMGVHGWIVLDGMVEILQSHRTAKYIFPAGVSRPCSAVSNRIPALSTWCRCQIPAARFSFFPLLVGGSIKEHLQTVLELSNTGHLQVQLWNEFFLLMYRLEKTHHKCLSLAAESTLCGIHFLRRRPFVGLRGKSRRHLTASLPSR